jgi:hypothetical protein
VARDGESTRTVRFFVGFKLFEFKGSGSECDATSEVRGFKGVFNSVQLQLLKTVKD